MFKTLSILPVWVTEYLLSLTILSTHAQHKTTQNALPIERKTILKYTGTHGRVHAKTLYDGSDGTLSYVKLFAIIPGCYSHTADFGCF